MANENINKVIYGGKVLIDLSTDNVTPDKILVGSTAHMPDGSVKPGTCTFDMDTSTATATASEVLATKKVGVKGKLVTGAMPNNGAVEGSVSTKDGTYTVPRGYHDGSGKVGIDATEKTKLIAANIRSGITILGIKGTMSSTEGAKPQAKTVTPKTTSQEITPDSAQGFNYLSQVNVGAIPYVETTNDAGGLTVAIA